MNCIMPGFPDLHYLPEIAQIHVPWVNDAIYPSHPLAPLQSFPASGSFPISRLFASDVQRIGYSASASVLPVNIQGWFSLGALRYTWKINLFAQLSRRPEVSPWPEGTRVWWTHLLQAASLHATTPQVGNAVQMTTVYKQVWKYLSL